MHCVLDTTVCWYASTVMAAPTHPSKSPVMFRSMLPPLGRLFAPLPRLPVLLPIDFFSCLLDASASLRWEVVGVGELKL